MEVIFIDSFISWIGGKKLLRKTITENFPTEKIDRYVEVFGGAGWVLFYKDKQAKEEIYNDINNELINLFKCVKYHTNALQEELDNTLNARETFAEYREIYQATALTDIQRAARYFYLIKSSYGSKAKHFGAKSRDITNTEYLKQIKVRLRTTVIENRSFEVLILQYDKENTLFYCDPPYFGTENFYDGGSKITDETKFTKESHEKLRDILAKITGKFILSYNDDEYIRDLYKGFNIKEVNRQNNLSKQAKTVPYRELIVKNY